MQRELWVLLLTWPCELLLIQPITMLRGRLMLKQEGKNFSVTNCAEWLFLFVELWKVDENRLLLGYKYQRYATSVWELLWEYSILYHCMTLLFIFSTSINFSGKCRHEGMSQCTEIIQKLYFIKQSRIANVSIDSNDLRFYITELQQVINKLSELKSAELNQKMEFKN